jgi:hypothetical protein
LLHAIHSHPPPPHGFLGLEISAATAENRWGLGFVYIISLFTFESSIVLSLISLYVYIKHLFPIETIIRKLRRRKTLAENHTTPMVSEIYTKKTISEGKSCVFTNSIL